MTSKKVIDKSGKSLNLMDIGGRLYPIFPLESLQNVFSMEARTDDILLSAYPKSGVQWIFEVVRFLIAGTTELPVVEKDVSMIDEASPSSVEALPSPRILSTHFHFQVLSPDFIRKKSKIIYITRDPRDVATSFFNHHKKLKHLYKYDGEWKDHFHLYLKGQVDYDSWFEYTKGWEKGMRQNPYHPFLVMSYEAMKKKPLVEIERLASFLGLECCDDFLRQVVDKSSFEVMKTSRMVGNDENAHVKYRQGQVGDWKNWFTVTQTELFNQVFEKEMVGTDAYKLYSSTLQKQDHDDS